MTREALRERAEKWLRETNFGGTMDDNGDIGGDALDLLVNLLAAAWRKG